MSVSASIPATVQIRRGRLLGLVAGVAVLAAAVTWVVLTFAVDAGSSTSQAVAPRVVAAPLTPAQRSIGVLPVRSVERAHAGPAADDPRLPGRSSRSRSRPASRASAPTCSERRPGSRRPSCR